MSEVVQCPKCHHPVTVGEDQAGARVQCPNCLKEFLTPSALGKAGASAEDEDWLVIEQPTTPDPPAAKVTRPPASEPDASSPFLETDGDADEDFFADSPLDDSPFVDSPEAQADSGETDPTDLFADLPPVSSPSASSKPAPQAARTLGENEEFRVTCPICGSITYAKAKQSGSTIKCSDCYSEIRVPKPPKKKTQPKRDEDAETFHFAETTTSGRPVDPFKKSADELLRAAEKDEKEPEQNEFTASFDAPSLVGWLKAVFGIFLDPGVIIHFVGLSLLLGIASAMAFSIPVLALASFPLGMIGITLTVACGFAIMFGVANGHERIEDWPTVDPTGWFEPMWLVIVATAIAVGPAYVIATVFGAPSFMTIGLVMFSVYTAFPIFLLSMLDMQSVTSPFSADVGKSITRCQEDWGAFYFSAGVLFAGLFAYFLLNENTTVTVAIGVVLSIAAAFIYFAMLGRLALAIGNVVELSALDDDEEDESS